MIRSDCDKINCNFFQIKAVKILLDNEADVNLQCPSRVDRKRALHVGAASGNVEVSELCKMMTVVFYFHQHVLLVLIVASKFP